MGAEDGINDGGSTSGILEGREVGTSDGGRYHGCMVDG